MLGFLLTVFIAIYFVLELGLYYNTRPRLANEIINFATQYATVQKKLLNEFEIPYALLDYTGKILWVNERFSELTGVGRNYHKSITTLFSNITREFLQKHEDAQNITIEKKERIFRISLNRIYFDDIMEESKEIDVKGSDEFLTALYLFDETELQHCRQENLDQKQVSALVYIDNYDEALDSIEFRFPTSSSPYRKAPLSQYLESGIYLQAPSSTASQPAQNQKSHRPYQIQLHRNRFSFP